MENGAQVLHDHLKQSGTGRAKLDIVAAVIPEADGLDTGIGIDIGLRALTESKISPGTVRKAVAFVHEWAKLNTERYKPKVTTKGKQNERDDKDGDVLP